MNATEILIAGRQARVFGLFSFPETLGSVIILWAITRLFRIKSALATVFLTVGMIGGVIGIHWWVGSNTQLNYMLGLCSCEPDINSVLGIFDC